MNAVFVLMTTGQARVASAVACKDRSGEVALGVYKKVAAQLLRKFAIGTAIARFHSDREKSFVGGGLRAHLESAGSWPTETEGYDHNANTSAEAMVKQLSRSLRAGLLDSTGGKDRCQEV